MMVFDVHEVDVVVDDVACNVSADGVAARNAEEIDADCVHCEIVDGDGVDDDVGEDIDRGQGGGGDNVWQRGCGQLRFRW